MSLDDLVSAHDRRVRRFARRRCGDPPAADDAVQEAYARLARRPDVVAHPGALSWVFTVVRNLCRRMLRAVAREPAAEVEPVVACDPATALAVRRALATLAPNDREILLLRDVEGRSGPEVCRLLGLAEPAMKTRLHRARARLRAALGGGGSRVLA